jgi:hypothetical protein
MDIRSRRFFKETQNGSSDIIYNPTFENMQVMPNVLLTLPKHYPFQYPILKIHGKNYVEYFSLLFIKYKPYIDLHHLRIECICCKSIICDWTPTWGMKDVIQECKSYGKTLGLISKSKWVLDKLLFDNLVCSIILDYLI